MQLLTTYVKHLIDSNEWSTQELTGLLKHIDTDRNIQAFRKVTAGVYSNEDLVRVKTIYTGRLMLQILLDRADNDELFKTVRVLDKALWRPDWEGALWEVEHAMHVVQTKQSIARLMKLGASQEKADFCMMLAEQHLRERFRNLYRRCYDYENSCRMDEDVRVYEYDSEEPNEHSVWCSYGHPVHEKIEELAARFVKVSMEKLQRFEAFLDR